MKDNTKIKDALVSIGEEGANAVIESTWIKELIADLLEKGVSEGVAELIGSIFVATVPRIGSFALSYKMKRLERNMQEMKSCFEAKIEALESNFSILSADKKELYFGPYAELLLDNIVDERQIDKIKWNVNGFVNLMTGDSNENTMQLFFDTLGELTVLDVDVLSIYSIDSDIDQRVIKDKYGLDNGQVKVVKEKLMRLGLLSPKNEELRNKNLDEIVVYFKKLDRDSKRTKSRGVEVPNSLKKVNGFESYRITSLGRGLLKTIER